MAQLMEVPEEVSDELFDKENVIGVAVGEKVSDGGVVSQDAVVVYVREKVEAERLDDADIVPTTVEIDDEEVRTDVQAVGDVRALAQDLLSAAESQPAQRAAGRVRQEPRELPEETQAIPDQFDPAARRKKWRPAPAGVSVGHPQITAGTLGTPPLRTRNGRLVFLTNTHVAAPVGKSSVGDSVLQPGRADGGQASDRIGTLLEKTDVKPKSSGQKNRTDSALVEVSPDHLQHDIFEIQGDLRGWAEAQVGQTYVKSGRTTSTTSGRCTARNATFEIGGFFDEPAVFENLDVFEPMSAGGDSGSLIGQEREGGFFGTSLLFAGSTQITLAIPMSAVQSHHGQLTPVQDDQNLVRPDDLRITGTQWRSTIQGNQTQKWFTFNWPAQYLVDWHIEPTTPGGNLESSVSIERGANGTKTYWITIKNLKNTATEFEGKYALFR